MIIIGHPFINYLPFYEIITAKDIEHTPPNSSVIFNFKSELAVFCEKNSVVFAVRVKDKKEAVLSNALKANYIIVDKNIAKDVQTIADEYMFDSKILLLARSEADFEWAIDSFIDGVLYKSGIRKI